MKIEGKEGVPKPHFPRLMKSKNWGTIVWMLDEDNGVLLHIPEAALLTIGRIGWTYPYSWEDFVDFDGTVTLSN